MKRKISSAIITASLVLSISTSTLGADYKSSVIINGSNQELEQIHVNEKQHIMFPIRTISEKLNYTVKWKNEDKSIELLKGENKIKFKIGTSKVSVNGTEVDIDSNPIIKNGKTLIPISFFDKALGLNLGWDNENKVLKINNPTEKSEKYFELSEDEIVRKNIDEYMKLLSEYQNFQGSLLISKQDKLILSKGYGELNVEQNIKNGVQTKFAIGSITKQFTAMSIMQLSEKGLISVEDKVSKYIPELVHGKDITIENLLTHTSGLKNYTELREFIVTDVNNKNPMVMVDLIKDMPLEFQPGETFHYSNTNYLLLGIIVERLSGVSLEDYLSENILKPLNMKDTGVSYGKENIIPDATPYVGFIEVQPLDDRLILSQAYGAGNMYSTVEDLYRWERALKTEKLVSRETMNSIFKSYVQFSENDGYGYGFIVSETDDGEKIGHGGNTLGFSAQLDKYIAKDLTIIVLTNKGQYNVSGLSENLKNITLKKDYKNPQNLKEIEVKDKSIYKEFAGNYQLAPSVTITITSENGKLYSQLSNQDKYEIFPLSETEYFYKIVDAKIEFIRDEQGKVKSLVLHQNSLDLRANKF